MIERILKENQHLLRMFIKDIPFALAIFDREMRYIYASDRWRSDYNLGERKLEGLSHYEVFPEIPERWREAHRRGLAGETLRSDGERFDRLDGSVQWGRWELHPWHDSAGAVSGIVIFTEDITKAKLAEQQLQESEGKYRSLFENIDEGFCLIEILFDDTGKPIDFRFLETNPSFEKKTGLTNVCGKTVKELSPQHEDYWFEIYGRVVLSGQPERFEIQSRQLRRWFDVFAFRYEQLNQRQVAVLFSDITKRKQVEQELLENEERFRDLTVASSEVVYCMSPNWREIKLLRGKDFIPDTGGPELTWLDKYIHPDDQPGVVEAISQAIRTKSIFELEHRSLRVDGSLGWTLSRAIPILDNNGNIVEWFGTASDITTRRQAKEDLTIEKHAAEEASRAKSEFVANMSHEIRTPMTVFLSALDFLLTVENTPQQRKILLMADKAAKNLRNIIDDILDFSKIEARKFVVHKEPLDLRECVKDIVEMFALQVKDKNLKLTANVTDDTPAIIVSDSAAINQILVNLIGNAIKFTEAGTVQVSVSAQEGGIALSVEDTGPGIPEDKLGMIFNSFYQADASINRKHGGTGLGLAICKGLVELLGGEIAAYNREGGGAIFTFTLPMERRERQIQEVLYSSAIKVKAGGPTAINILLVEDDAMIREVISIALEERGWRVVVATDGKEAVENWREGHFDVVLMDIQLPQMNGLEVSRLIRKEEGFGDSTPIIGFTAHVGTEMRKQCLDAGMNRVLSKPVHLEDLYRSIEHCLAT